MNETSHTAMLPNTFAEAFEADVFAYACESVRMIRDEKISFFGLPLSWFEKPDSRWMVRQWMKDMAAFPLAMLDLTNLARCGWDLADEALRELIVDYEYRREEKPPPLGTYAMEVADPRRRYRRPHGQKKADFILRDLAITWIVGDLRLKFGLKPTRQLASKKTRPSGCRIVARALKTEGLAISEADVVSIWTRYGRLAFPSELAALGPRPL